MDDVARHYDTLDEAYRRAWGEHVHHGLWRSGAETRTQATRALLDHALAHAELPAAARVVDVGCGYGASAGVLVSEHQADVVGFTLSAAQAARAPAGVDVRVRDWLRNDLPAGEADLVLALESLSHMADLPRAFAEAARVLRAGGRLVLVDWLAADGLSARRHRALLAPIEREGRLPRLAGAGEYARWAREAELEPLGFEDLTARARRTWPLARRRLARLLLTDPEVRRVLVSRTNSEWAFALSLFRIPVAYRLGAMRLGLLWARKR